MNRGVMVTRGDPDEDELELSARYMNYFTNLSVLLCFFSGEYVLILKMTL